jgi:molecular chaperone IbpA
MSNYELQTLMNIADLHRISVGFDNMFNRLHSVPASGASGYPPYNVIKTSDTLTTIEIAVAGFHPDDLDVSLQNGLLSVTGENTIDNTAQYLYRGIATRKFNRSWQLADGVEVKSASVENGLLVITLEHVIPEEDKPKKIAIRVK